MNNIGTVIQQLQTIVNMAVLEMTGAAIEQVKRIYLHGDGGTWMNRAKDVFPNLIRVMDKFHLQKRFRKLSHLKDAPSYMSAIYRSIRVNDFSAFVGFCAKIDQQQNENGHERVKEQINFI